jgi:hypothetical protein
MCVSFLYYDRDFRKKNENKGGLTDTKRDSRCILDLYLLARKRAGRAGHLESLALSNNKALAVISFGNANHYFSLPGTLSVNKKLKKNGCSKVGCQGS